MICTARALLQREGLALGETGLGAVTEGFLDYPMSMGDFFSCGEDGAGQRELHYKRHLRLDSFDNVCRTMPALYNAGAGWLEDRPLFTERLAELREALPGELAVEGGPCLYGADEVFAVLQLRGGERLFFDLSSGACLAPSGGPGLADFLRERGGEVCDVSFLNVKAGFSSQELELFWLLFSAAFVLKCPLVLSLPDMSYRKYFDRLARYLPPDVGARASVDYGKLVHRITDLYLELATMLQKRFRITRLVRFHERNRAAYGIFKRERERFCTVSQVSTNRPDLRDAIHDYITLPAAPFYLLGARHVLEINSTDEADPLRKCAKFHKHHVDFHLFMLPEPVGTDGQTTVFQAGREHKGYVLLEDLRRRGRENAVFAAG